MFGTGIDPINLKSGLEECSWNQLTVVPGIGDENEVATGVIEVTITVPLNGSSDNTIKNAVTTEVQNKLGHSLPGEYDYVLYSLEDCYGSSCGWAAYAYVNHWNSVYISDYYKRPGVLMHEVGRCVVVIFFKSYISFGDSLLTSSSVKLLAWSQLRPRPFRRLRPTNLH